MFINNKRTRNAALLLCALAALLFSPLSDQGPQAQSDLASAERKVELPDNLLGLVEAYRAEGNKVVYAQSLTRKLREARLDLEGDVQEMRLEDRLHYLFEREHYVFVPRGEVLELVSARRRLKDGPVISHEELAKVDPLHHVSVRFVPKVQSIHKVSSAAWHLQPALKIESNDREIVFSGMASAVKNGLELAKKQDTLGEGGSIPLKGLIFYLADRLGKEFSAEGLDGELRALATVPTGFKDVKDTKALQIAIMDQLDQRDLMLWITEKTVSVISSSLAHSLAETLEVGQDVPEISRVYRILYRTRFSTGQFRSRMGAIGGRNIVKGGHVGIDYEFIVRGDYAKRVTELAKLADSEESRRRKYEMIQFDLSERDLDIESTLVALQGLFKLTPVAAKGSKLVVFRGVFTDKKAFQEEVEKALDLLEEKAD